MPRFLTHRKYETRNGCWFVFLFFLHLVFVATCRLSLVSMSRDYSLIVVHGFLIAAASLVAENCLLGTWALPVAAGGLSSCGVQV